MKDAKIESEIDQEVERLEQNEAWEASDDVVYLKAKVPLDKVIPVRLSADHWQRLRKQATEFGIGPSTLARMWIIERLIGKSFAPVLTGVRQLNHDYGFTVRERDIFELVSHGYPVKEIAQNLHMSEATVKRYLSTMGSKLSKDSAYTASSSSE
jgi:ATP/maltotriose-dependent transcriptional regulator MalT